MQYLVEITEHAYGDLRSIYKHIEADTSNAAQRWFNGMEAAVMSLSRLPNRGKEITPNRRQILYGKRNHMYSIVYMVMERRRAVRVLYIRHGAREEVSASHHY